MREYFKEESENIIQSDENIIQSDETIRAILGKLGKDVVECLTTLSDDIIQEMTFSDLMLTKTEIIDTNVMLDTIPDIENLEIGAEIELLT